MPRTITIPTNMTRPSLAVLRARQVDWPLQDDTHLPRPGTARRAWIDRLKPVAVRGGGDFPLVSAYEIRDAEGHAIGLCLQPERAGLGMHGEWLIYHRGRYVGDSRSRTRCAMSLSAGAREIGRREDKAIKAWGRRRRMSQADEAALAGLGVP